MVQGTFIMVWCLLLYQSVNDIYDAEEVIKYTVIIATQGKQVFPL